jgi:hypothetical protein
MKPVKEYQLVNHFNTRGTLPSGFRDVGSGVGTNPTEALEAALRLLQENGWEVGELRARIMAENAAWLNAPVETDSSYHFVSVHVR